MDCYRSDCPSTPNLGKPAVACEKPLQMQGLAVENFRQRRLGPFSEFIGRVLPPSKKTKGLVEVPGAGMSTPESTCANLVKLAIALENTPQMPAFDCPISVDIYWTPPKDQTGIN